MSDFDAARRHVRLAAEYHDLPASKVDSLMTAFDIAARSSLDGDVKFLDLHGKPLLDENYGDADVAAWLRYTARVSPHLLAKPAETKAADPAPAADVTTMTGIMLALKAGTITDAQADDAMRALSPRTAPQFAPVPYRPNTTADLDPGSVSARMAAARNDPAAMAALSASLGLN